jgi:hypothetical protein
VYVKCEKDIKTIDKFLYEGKKKKRREKKKKKEEKKVKGK